nr:hypothetical protein [Kineosporia sp. NBRC 101731]
MFVYRIPAVFFFGVGVVPGMVATTVFAIPPAWAPWSCAVSAPRTSARAVGRSAASPRWAADPAADIDANPDVP